MSGNYEVQDVTFKPATPADEKRGLLGYVSFNLGSGLRVDGAAVRRTLAGSLAISYPARRDRAGRDHFVLRPLNNETQEDLKRQILASLRRQGALQAMGSNGGASDSAAGEA